MLSINGEGGEILDLLGKYPFNRGIQIASGRFGITAETINSANLIEIKVGQGAKPGEGGHLPARKVTKKVASARHARAAPEDDRRAALSRAQRRPVAKTTIKAVPTTSR